MLGDVGGGGSIDRASGSEKVKLEAEGLGTCILGDLGRKARGADEIGSQRSEVYRVWKTLMPGSAFPDPSAILLCLFPSCIGVGEFCPPYSILHCKDIRGVLPGSASCFCSDTVCGIRSGSTRMEHDSCSSSSVSPSEGTSEPNKVTCH